MTFLKRIFSKPKGPVTQPKPQVPPYFPESKDSLLFPYLKPADWPGLQAGAFGIPIQVNGKTPFVLTLGYDSPQTVKYVTQTDIVERDPADFQRVAMLNLDKQNQPVETISKLQDKFITASGEEFSAEKILRPTHLALVHQLLKSPRILISIPRRRCFMAMDQSAEKDYLPIFQMFHDHAWNDASYGNPQIVNGLLVSENGVLVDFIPR